ncbi:MAG: DNA-binding protein, partial [Pseudonocardia sp.]|nr:DNA-binding protein [Pseudonocardia sp.]
MGGDDELLSVGEVAQILDVAASRVHQCLRDGVLVAVLGSDGLPRIPAAFVRDGAIVKGLAGVVTVLRDAHFSDEEIVEWLLRADTSLP